MNQRSQPTDLDQPRIEPQNEAITPKKLPSGAEQKAFAHDINFKIDQLESNIDSLAKQYKVSEGNFKLAIGDISSRTTLVTQEISKVNEQILKAEINNKDLVAALDARLKQSLEKLHQELSGIDSQITAHQSTLQSIKADLDESDAKLTARIDTLEQTFSNQLSDLTAEQEKQHKTQQVFTESLDSLESKNNQIADELYATQVDNATQQRLYKKYFAITVGTLASAILATLGAVTYYHWNHNEVSPVVTQEIDTKVHSLEQSVNSRFATHSNMEATTLALTTKIDTLNTQVSDASQELSEKHQATTDSLAALADRVASLQLSVYGPEDSADNAVIPEIAVKDAQWIAKQNPENYSIQLVGVYRERSMINFVNQHSRDLQDQPVAFNLSKYRGQNWYNVIYGNFATLNEAQTALDKLPKDLQKNAPWVRQMGSIQRTAIQ